MNVSEAQVKAMDAMIVDSIQPDKATLEVLESMGLVANGLVTQEGLKHVTVPTVEVDVITFGSDTPYNQMQPNGKYKTIKLPKGTEMIVTFGIEAKDQLYYEGMINLNGKPLWVRIARSPRFVFSKRLMPYKEKE
jgi:hypothetical protein